jgi:MerE protein
MDTLILSCVVISVPIIAVVVVSLRNRRVDPRGPAARAGTTCRVPVSPPHSEAKGIAWLIGGFLFCPCHLPLTLAASSAVLSGTAAGALLNGHPYVAGSLITLAWIAATWRGFQYLR